MKRFYFYRFGGTLLSLIALSGCPTLTSPQVDKVKQEKENTKAAANLAANIPSNLVSLTGAISNSLTPTISGTTAIGAKVAL